MPLIAGILHKAEPEGYQNIFELETQHGVGFRPQPPIQADQAVTDHGKTIGAEKQESRAPRAIIHQGKRWGYQKSGIHAGVDVLRLIPL